MLRSKGAEDSRPAAQREVSHLLGTLRAEHLRHERNVLRRARAPLPSKIIRTFNDPSLPFSDIYDYTAPGRQTGAIEEGTGPATPRPNRPYPHDYPDGPVPGPPVPRSWSRLFKQDQNRPSALAFRRQALSLVFSHTPRTFGSSDVPDIRDGLTEPEASSDGVPPLTHLCLGVLLAECADPGEFRSVLLPALPPTFRRDVLRYTAVHAPLPNAKLYALCAPVGHADGELIVVGPQASVLNVEEEEEEEKEDDDQGAGPSSSTSAAGINAVNEKSGRHGHGDDEQEDSWEEDAGLVEDEPPPLHTLVILNAVVSHAALLAFPLTLTRLALVALPIATPVHRLPRLCPLLEVLDLSYNPWLNLPPSGVTITTTEATLELIDWGKWSHLRVLGLRECNVPKEVLNKVNKGRWPGEEVEVIGVEESPVGTSISVVEGMMQNLRLGD
ncbi:uncharacterized protein BXZ73DRAFT_37000 [Epithele typhae]|uniref:uncharacterized protein n=1 Tax=Epithele typhae TaxID=378194 RepID=UPI0020085BC7|nr:uncharacterized protein BXZ73DRAFT_37000 [Epithele typhae]KAH9946111.1 hypothetical protein BXZ73DRAFT_37000 [Epithele typhae]